MDSICLAEKLLTTTGQDLRRTLSSLKQIFQEDKDLVHGFVADGGLDCLVRVGSEADQNYQNYILRALGQVRIHLIFILRDLKIFSLPPPLPGDALRRWHERSHETWINRSMAVLVDCVQVPIVAKDSVEVASGLCGVRRGQLCAARASH